MGNRPRLKFSADAVTRITKGYEERIQNQISIINRLKDENLALQEQAREGKGAQIITTCLLKRAGEPVVISRAELESADVSEVTIVERTDGGLLARMEVYDV